MKRLKLVVMLSVGAFLCASAMGQASAQCTGHAELTESDRNGFISRAYGEDAEVRVHVLAAPGCESAVPQSLEKMGANLLYAEEKIGYAVVTLPKAKVLDVLDIPGIEYAKTMHESAFISSEGDDYFIGVRKDESYLPPSERKVEPVPPISLPIPRVGKTLPNDGPYFAADEAGLTELWRQHPEADGRGVKIALFDEGVDLLHPALQLAKDANGNLVPKFADVITTTSPDQNSGWVQFGEQIQTANGTFEAAGHTWMAPADGTYHFGIFSKKIHLAGDFDEEEEKKYHIKSIQLAVGVLWEERSNRVWVDTDGDGKFQNQRALGDYGETHDIDWFGRKEGEDDNRIPFGVKIDRERRAAFLSIAFGGHGGYVVGPLAANRLTGGLFDGAAPNAQVIDVQKKRFFPTLLRTFARSDVDVVNWSGGWGQPSPDGQDDFGRRVVERAISAYNKPMACTCGMANAVNVLDYVSPEMLRRNRRTGPPYLNVTQGIAWFSPDGMENLVMTPATSLVTESRYLPYSIFDGAISDAPAPPGYAIGANPSPTIPVVSGVLADLISEAKREHIRYDAARLTQAVRIGARRLEEFPTSQQVFGVVNAAGAWKQLAQMAGGDDPENPKLTSFTFARSEGGQLKPANGFHADLPKAASLTGELWITRHGGYAGGRAYTLSLAGDDGTYQLTDETVIFVRDQPTRVRFRAKPAPGMHVAFLQLKDSQANAVMQEVPLGLRAPDSPEMLGPWIEQYRTTIRPRNWTVRYVGFGEETQAARYVLRIPSPGAHGLFDLLPSDWSQRKHIDVPKPAGKPIDEAHHVGPMQTIEMIAPNTEAGTNEIRLENRSGAEYEGPPSPPDPDVPITATLRVEKFSVAFNRRSGHLLATNKQAALEGKVEFYDANLTSSDLTGSGPHSMATLKRTLPANLSQWRVSVTTSTGKGMVDAFLLDCTSKEGCSVADQKSLSSHGTSFVVDDPAAGDWQIVIRARDASSRPGAYRLREASLVPNNTVTDQDAKRRSGETWSASVPVQAGQAHYAAFRIAGVPVRFLDDDGKDSEKYTAAAKQATVYDAADSAMRIGMTPLVPDAP